jgi:RNA polymerase sigma-70 factor (ECF subfamily)
LSPELREAIVLRDIEGMSYSEIADLCKVPEGTVKSRINRGRLELAKLLMKRRARTGMKM